MLHLSHDTELVKVQTMTVFKKSIHEYNPLFNLTVKPVSSIFREQLKTDAMSSERMYLLVTDKIQWNWLMRVENKGKFVQSEWCTLQYIELHLQPQHIL